MQKGFSEIIWGCSAVRVRQIKIFFFFTVTTFYEKIPSFLSTLSVSVSGFSSVKQTDLVLPTLSTFNTLIYANPWWSDSTLHEDVLKSRYVNTITCCYHIRHKMIKTRLEQQQPHAWISLNESAINQEMSVLVRVQATDQLTSSSFSDAGWWSILTHLSKVSSNILIKHTAAERRTWEPPITYGAVCFCVCASVCVGVEEGVWLCYI